ncbi:MAG: ferrochelatase [Acidobacteriota bacterium]|jgi:ferrochelatase
MSEHRSTVAPQLPAPDAVLVVGFGGPERREDVLPFLENVLAGKRVPRERMLQVAEHYYHLGGISPINQQVRDLLALLEPALRQRRIDLPVYWGNRNWHPLLPDTYRRMARERVRHAVALVLSPYSSYSGCRQYRENLDAARAAAGPGAPTCVKARPFFNHPDFIAANVARVREALGAMPSSGRDGVHVAYTAHSIPRSMAVGCDYEQQLLETCRMVSRDLAIDRGRWSLVYQSRSGRPADPWLEPDILDHLEACRDRGVEDLIVHPIGFVSDHMEVLFDLDREAGTRALELGVRMVRSPTVGTHARFVETLVDLVAEQLEPARAPRAVGAWPARPSRCPDDCCAYAARSPSSRP